jgi:hypothetical protein
VKDKAAFAGFSSEGASSRRSFHGQSEFSLTLARLTHPRFGLLLGSEPDRRLEDATVFLPAGGVQGTQRSKEGNANDPMSDQFGIDIDKETPQPNQPTTMKHIGQLVLTFVNARKAEECPRKSVAVKAARKRQRRQADGKVLEEFGERGGVR